MSLLALIAVVGGSEESKTPLCIFESIEPAGLVESRRSLGEERFADVEIAFAFNNVPTDGTLDPGHEIG